MLSSRKTLLRAAAFACLFIVLTYPWPPVGHVFTKAFSSVANVGLAASFEDPNVHVHFAAADPRVPEQQSPGEWNIVLFSEDALTGQESAVPLGVRRIAYVPVATFLALLAVTPVHRRRKLLIGAVGVALLTARVVAAVALPLARHFGVFEKGSLSDSLACVAYYSLIEPPNLMYGAPLVVWGLLLLLSAPRGADWLRGSAQPRPTRQPQ